MTRRKHLIAWLAGAIVIVALIHDEIERRKVYSFGVTDFLARDLRDRRVQIRGLLAPGTLCRIEEPCGYRFTLVDTALTQGDRQSRSHSPRLPVRFDGCVVPDSFVQRPGFDVDVYVVGERCQTCHSFNATDIMTRSYLYPASPAPPKLPPLCDELAPRM
jgi:hypothetical protein